MKKSKKSKKPTGTTGSLKIESGKAPAFEQVMFPDSKSEIEQLVAASFVATLGDLGLKIHSLAPSKENDLDFKIETDTGTAYLELMEIAPLELTKGSYDQASNSYLIYDFVKAITEKVAAKSAKYTSSKQPRIFLLIYVTHWTFNLGVQGLCLLQYWLSQSDLCFEAIYLHTPSPSGGISEYLFPTPKEHWAALNFDPDAYKGLKAFAVDLRHAKTLPG